MHEGTTPIAKFGVFQQRSSSTDGYFWVLVARFFVLWWMWCFAGDFDEYGCKNVVCCWSFCGDKRGKAGHLQVVISALTMRRYFRFIFGRR
jgi:hypothetical protein